MAPQGDAVGSEPTGGGSAIVYLIGFPAAGKLTVARALVELSADRFILVDNHHVNNTIFAVIRTDGVSMLPPEVWPLVEEVRNTVLRAIETVASPELSYVFTNVLVAGSASDEALLSQLREIATRRGSLFVPVRLHCDVEELARRIGSDDRRARMKWIDPEGLRAWLPGQRLLDAPDAFDLDVTSMTPEEAADAILAVVDQRLGELHE